MEVLSRFVRRASLAPHAPQDSSEKQRRAELLVDFYVFKTLSVIEKWRYSMLMIRTILSTHFLSGYLINRINEEETAP
jgi:hypothetical protein